MAHTNDKKLNFEYPELLGSTRTRLIDNPKHDKIAQSKCTELTLRYRWMSLWVPTARHTGGRIPITA